MGEPQLIYHKFHQDLKQVIIRSSKQFHYACCKKNKKIKPNKLKKEKVQKTMKTAR